MQTNEVLALSKRDAAKSLSLSIASIDRMLARGAIRARKIGNRTVILKSEVERVLNEAPDAIESGAIRKVE
jgi:predicted DNA-binding transcriptional regulator AlpA